MSTMDDIKQKKKLYGKTMAPVECTRAYSKDMPFDHKMTTQSFILVNDNATTLPDGRPTVGSRTHANLYNGITGNGWDANRSTHPLGDAKEAKKKLRDYHACEISTCPIAKQVDPISEEAKARVKEWRDELDSNKPVVGKPAPATTQ